MPEYKSKRGKDTSHFSGLAIGIGPVLMASVTTLISAITIVTISQTKAPSVLIVAASLVDSAISLASSTALDSLASSTLASPALGSGTLCGLGLSSFFLWLRLDNYDAI